jgi:ribosome-binding protein aMBF1 (putative translation factor)
MTEPLIIEHEGRPTHVVLPYAEWRRIRRLMAELDDLRDVERARAEDEIPLEIAERLWAGENSLRVWRQHRGLSQAALAERCGLPQPTIARIETGSRRGTTAQMQRLAKALEVRLDALVGWEMADANRKR